jgi:DNA-binding transcriptional LysR family regulator
MELQIDLLKTFLAIIDTGGFTNASQVVHRTQPANVLLA